MDKEIIKQVEEAKSRFVPKPRNTERDATIVRLHDEKKFSFGQIGRQLFNLNKAWVGPDGKYLQRDAVRQAYYRLKNKKPR